MVHDEPIDLVAAAHRLPSDRRKHLDGLLNGGLFLSHTSVDAPFIQQHIEQVVVAEFYGALFFYNQGFPMSEAYEPLVGQALLSCRVMLIVISAAALQSRYMKAEVEIASARRMSAVICGLDGTNPLELHRSLRESWNPWARRRVASVDFSESLPRAADRLRSVLTKKAFRCTHSLLPRLQ